MNNCFDYQSEKLSLELTELLTELGTDKAMTRDLLISLRLSPRPSRSIDFDGVSETNGWVPRGPRDSKTIDRGEISRPRNWANQYTNILKWW